MAEQTMAEQEITRESESPARAELLQNALDCGFKRRDTVNVVVFNDVNLMWVGPTVTQVLAQAMTLKLDEAEILVRSKANSKLDSRDQMVLITALLALRMVDHALTADLAVYTFKITNSVKMANLTKIVIGTEK